MKRNYIDEPNAEIMIQMKDGTEYHILGTPIETEIGYEASLFTLWGVDELRRMTPEEILSRPVGFFLPDGDLSAKIEYGYLCIYKNNELLLMEDRNKIKKIMSGIDYLIDFNDTQ